MDPLGLLVATLLEPDIEYAVLAAHGPDRSTGPTVMTGNVVECGEAHALMTGGLARQYAWALHEDRGRWARDLLGADFDRGIAVETAADLLGISEERAAELYDGGGR